MIGAKRTSLERIDVLKFASKDNESDAPTIYNMTNHNKATASNQPVDRVDSLFSADSNCG